MDNITSSERVFKSLKFEEPDKVPLFLLFSYYGAKVLKTSIKDYFLNPDNIVEAQLKLHKKYKTDCLYAFFYASIETEAFGGETIFVEDGPPNSGRPVISKTQDIFTLKVPEIDEHANLTRVLDTIKKLKNEVNDNVPIIGVVMSPFSLPVMQLGFDNYLNILVEQKLLFEKLIDINTQFCINWANAQLNAGATAICYFDPVSSPDIVESARYRNTGFKIAKNVISKIQGPTATHFASSSCSEIIDDITQTGTYITSAGTFENISEVKKKCYKRLTVLGNLNGIEMCRWDAEQTERNVENLILKAGQGGGFILAESHGEIPYYVSEKTLETITNTVDKCGRYPINSIE